MKNLSLTLFISSIFALTRFASALECPDVLKVDQTGNIVNLSEIVIKNNGFVGDYIGGVKCVYTYTSSSNQYNGQQKTFTFNYPDGVYLADTTATNNNWNFTQNSVECKSENPADCTFTAATSLTDVKQLQRCPDTLTDPGGGLHHFNGGTYNSPGQVGTTRCEYNLYQKDGADTQIYEALYFDSDDHYNQSLWLSYGSRLFCSGNASGHPYEGNPLFVNPDDCDFYLAN